jgi:hypothetical protein
MAIIAGVTGQLSGGDLRAAPTRDPEEVFRKACKRLVDLEAKHDLLKTVSDAKPAVERVADADASVLDYGPKA